MSNSDKNLYEATDFRGPEYYSLLSIPVLQREQHSKKSVGFANYQELGKQWLPLHLHMEGGQVSHPTKNLPTYTTPFLKSFITPIVTQDHGQHFLISRLKLLGFFTGQHYEVGQSHGFQNGKKTTFASGSAKGHPTQMSWKYTENIKTINFEL